MTRASCETAIAYLPRRRAFGEAAGSLEEPLEEVDVLDEVAQAEEVLAYAFSRLAAQTRRERPVVENHWGKLSVSSKFDHQYNAETFELLDAESDNRIYYLVYSQGKIKSIKMWSIFDLFAFKALIKDTGAWESLAMHHIYVICRRLKVRD